MTIDAPLCLHRATVKPDWLDYNGHMNEAYYVLVFSNATDAFMDYAGGYGGKVAERDTDPLAAAALSVDRFKKGGRVDASHANPSVQILIPME